MKAKVSVINTSAQTFINDADRSLDVAGISQCFDSNQQTLLNQQKLQSSQESPKNANPITAVTNKEQTTNGTSSHTAPGKSPSSSSIDIRKLIKKKQHVKTTATASSSSSLCFFLFVF